MLFHIIKFMMYEKDINLYSKHERLAEIGNKIIMSHLPIERHVQKYRLNYDNRWTCLQNKEK